MIMLFVYYIFNFLLTKWTYRIVSKNGRIAISACKINNSPCSSFSNKLTIIKNQYIAPLSLYNFQFVKPSIPYFLLKEYSLHEILA